MRFGCCLNMLGNTVDPVGRQYIPLLVQAGYDYMELPLAQVMELSETEFVRLQSQVKESGIPCLCCNNFFPASVRLTGETADPYKIQQYVVGALARAAGLGVKTIVFGSSGAKNIPAGFPREEAMHQIVALLQDIGTQAASLGIQIVIEPLCREESNCIRTLEEGNLLVEQVHRSNVALLVDYYHFFKERENFAALKQYLHHIRHVHFAKPEGRCVPTGPDPELQSFFTVLRQGGYDGTVSLEAYTHNPQQDLRKAVWVKNGWD